MWNKSGGIRECSIEECQKNVPSKWKSAAAGRFSPRCHSPLGRQRPALLSVLKVRSWAWYHVQRYKFKLLLFFLFFLSAKRPNLTRRCRPGSTHTVNIYCWWRTGSAQRRPVWRSDSPAHSSLHFQTVQATVNNAEMKEWKASGDKRRKNPAVFQHLVTSKLLTCRAGACCTVSCWYCLLIIFLCLEHF